MNGSGFSLGHGEIFRPGGQKKSSLMTRSALCNTLHGSYCGFLYETLQLEIITVLESLNQLRESPDYELCQLSERKPGALDALAAERAKVLDQEAAELEKQADRLAKEITELAGETPQTIG
jgi:hypothetical protein